MTTPTRRNRLPASITFGPMPHDSVNKTLGLEIDDGMVIMSGRSQIHTSNKRPDIYTQCLPHIARIVSAPLYIGDDLKNAGKIELVGRVLSINKTILVAVDLEKDLQGNYRVVTFYPISDQKVTNRLGNGFLKIAK